MPALTPFLPEPVSGEAVSFDPFIVVPGGGIRSGVSSVIKPARSLLDDLLRLIRPTPIRQPTEFGDIFKTFPGAARGTPTFTPPNIIEAAKNFIKSPPKTIPSGQGAAIKSASKIQISTGTKALIGTSAVLGTASLGFVTLTPGGQQFTKLGQDIVGAAKPLAEGAGSIIQTLGSSPLLLGGLIILGGILLLKK